MFTLVGPATMPVPVPGPAMGAAAFDDSEPTTVVTPRLTGGISLAFADTSLGTSSVRVTSAISSFLTSTFCSALVGLASSCFSGAFCTCGTGTGATQIVTVYGRIPASQNVGVGGYVDTITATVTF